MFAQRSSTYDPSARGPDPGAGFPRRGVRAGLAALLALLVVAVGAPSASAQQQTWPCDAYGYLFQTRAADGPHEIVQVDLATGEQNQIATMTNAVNAVGYNAVDEFFYGMESVPNPITGVASWRLGRVHPDGSVENLGVPTGPGGTMNAAGSYPLGEVDLNGHYWAVDTTTAPDTWYEVDLTTTPTPTLLRSGQMTLPAGITAVGADWTWINGVLYSFGASTDGTTHLVSFDPDSTPVISDLGIEVAGGFGAAFSDASGYVYGSQNATGDIYRIDPGTGQVILASDQGEPSPGNDGARCANAVVPTITVTKTVNGRVRPADQFTVGLLRPDGSAATSATTSGTDATASTVNFPASQGQTYTITEAMAAGSPTPLGEYVKSIACTDAAGNAVAAGGSGPTWTLTVADATFYTCNVTNSAVSDLQLVKTASPTPVVPGEDVTFSLTVTNAGPSTSIGETITDQLPPEVTFSGASAGCGEAGGTVTCAVGELAPGESRTFTISGAVASDLDHCLRNTGTVTGAFDPATSNNAATICTPIEGRSNVTLTKRSSAETVAAGGQVMYTLVVENEGPSDDPGVTVTDALPAGLSLVSAEPSQGSCTTTNNTVSCDLGALRDRGSAQVLVTANATGAGCITNTAGVQGAHEDPEPANNQASARICVEPVPPATFDLEVDKRASARRPALGQRLRYRIVVTNNGPAAAPNAKVTDTYNSRASVVSVRSTAGTCTDEMPVSCELGTIAAGESVTIIVVIRPRETGRARNAASATGDGTDTTPGNNMDTADVRVRKVRLRVSKVASRSSVQAGDLFSYRIRVKNRTRGVARRVRVCDRLPSGLVFVGAKPRARTTRGRQCWTIRRLGARKAKTFRVRVRALPGASGRKVNRVTANGRDVRRARARERVRVNAGRVLGGGVTG